MGNFKGSKKTHLNTEKQCRCTACPYGAGDKPDSQNDVWCGVADVDAGGSLVSGYVIARSGDYPNCTLYLRAQKHLLPLKNVSTAA